eukprot:677929-Alexandrium_andersonii.AAC.1
MNNSFKRSGLELHGDTNDIQTWSAKLARGALCAASRRDSASADERGDSRGPKSRTARRLAGESPDYLTEH